MFDGLGTELNLIINNICEKLGTTVDELIPEFCKYKVYEAIGYISAFSIISVFIIIVMLFSFMHAKKAEEWYVDYVVVEVILGILLFVFICGIAYQVYFLIIWRNAPTGATVDYLIKQLKNY